MRSDKKWWRVLFVAAGVVFLVGGEAWAIIGRPLTPLSFAGVARRTVRRGMYYR